VSHGSFVCVLWLCNVVSFGIFNVTFMRILKGYAHIHYNSLLSHEWICMRMAMHVCIHMSYKCISCVTRMHLYVTQMYLYLTRMYSCAPFNGRYDSFKKVCTHAVVVMRVVWHIWEAYETYECDKPSNLRTIFPWATWDLWYGVATIGSLLKVISFFCRI